MYIYILVCHFVKPHKNNQTEGSVKALLQAFKM